MEDQLSRVNCIIMKTVFFLFTYFGIGSYTIDKYFIIYDNIYTIDGKSSNN